MRRIKDFMKCSFCSPIVVFILFFSVLNFSLSAQACTGGVAGQMLYNSTAKVFQYCDGTNWIAMSAQGSGSGGCTSPTVPEGGLVFNATHRVNMGCAGNVYRALGPYFNPTASNSTGANAFRQIWSVLDHSCAIDLTNKLLCWGKNLSDVSGQPGGGIVAVPTEVSIGGTWNEVRTGNESTTAIRSDGTLRWWGTLTPGIGNNVGAPNTWKKADSGYHFICGIRSNDTMWCRHRFNSQATAGEAGNGTLISSDTFSAVIGGHTWKELEISGDSVCAIKSDDTIWCWGSDGSGQLGNGATTGNQATPAQINDASTWRSITGGNNNYCAIRSDNTGWCWGRGWNHELGNGSNSDRISPVQISGGHTWKKLSLGWAHACGIRMDDTLWCWGSQANGSLGNGLTSGSQTTPIQILAGQTFRNVAAGNGFTCAITANNARLCWGDNNFGQLGALSVPSMFTQPVSINDSSPYNSVTLSGWTAGGLWACAIRTSGQLFCWGNNGNGRLGIGNTTSTATPTQVSGGGLWKFVYAADWGAAHTCGIKDDDTLWCWGRNHLGQLGLGATGSDQLSPQQVGSDKWKFVTAFGLLNGDESKTCGIKLDDTLWCWGSQIGGKLGTGVMTGNQPTPTQIGAGQTWLHVNAGQDNTCAVRSDTTLWCWGASYTAIPVQLTLAGTGWRTVSLRPVSSGGQVTMAIKTDNTVWRFSGDTDGGDVGTIPDIYEYAPTAAGMIQGVTVHSRKSWSPLIEIGTNGQLYSRNPSTGAQTLLDSGQWISASEAGSGRCGIKSDFRVYCWGEFSNYLGQPSISVTAPNPVIGDCGTPATQAGALRYNSTLNVMTFCDGIGFSTIGK
jgi:alpha-tubulin suppressor-like RCC1 family protein